MKEIIYSPDRKSAVFDGAKYYRNSTSGYYFKYRGSLHRAVYIYHGGQIPDGYEIHHKDGDKSNNEIGNLECVEIREHHRQHMRNRPPELVERTNYILMTKGQEEAKKWHKSPEGRKWHKEHWHECKDVMFQERKLVCAHCGGVLWRRKEREARA